VQESLKHCERLVACLVEMLVRCEEQDAALAGTSAFDCSTALIAVSDSSCVICAATLDAKAAARLAASGGGNGDGNGNGSSQGSPLKGGRGLKDQLVACVVTLAVFCEAHPPLAARHLAALLPYLKGA